MQSDLVAGGGSSKENDLKKTLGELVKNAEAIDGVNKITLDELFNTGFMKKRTRFSSTDGLFCSDGISVNSADDLNAILGDEFDQYLRQVTSFSSWNEVVETAYAEWVTIKPFEGVYELTDVYLVDTMRITVWEICS